MFFTAGKSDQNTQSMHKYEKKVIYYFARFYFTFHKNFTESFWNREHVFFYQTGNKLDKIELLTSGFFISRISHKKYQ